MEAGVGFERFQELRIERCKLPDVPHYAHPGWYLGADEHGHWLGLQAGSPVTRGDKELFKGKWDGLMLVPVDAWFVAWWPGGGDLELYVDVSTPAVWTDGGVRVVDLDLDVVRTRDGDVRLLDEDEFADHQIRYGYSADLIAGAEASASRLMACVRSGDEPFARGAPARWWAEVVTLSRRS